MTAYQILFLAWVVVTIGLAGVAIYRAVAELHEDDQLFLDPAEARFEREQKDVIRSIRGLDHAVARLAWCSAALFAAMILAGAYRAFA
ncbi:MAG: hypothetical protein R2762_12055 [Bryobacteraceae bacterium]